MTAGRRDRPGDGDEADPRFELLEVCAQSAPLRSRPDADAPLQTELLRGERFRAVGRQGEWFSGEAEIDGYEGHVATRVLRPAGPEPTHRVRARATLLYFEPDATSESAGIAWLGSRLAISDHRDGSFAETVDGHWVPADHLQPLRHHASDPAAVAERCAGAPYLYGGRTGTGLDCSALIQLALQAAGIPAPRDSGPQSRLLGTPVAEGQPLRRNDLAFWEGHVGILLDQRTLLHANAHHMAVASEPLDAARNRLREREVDWLGIRRLGTVFD